MLLVTSGDERLDTDDELADRGATTTSRAEPGGSALAPDQPQGAGAIVHLELAHDRKKVSADGDLRDKEPSADLGCSETLVQELEHLPLPRSEPGTARHAKNAVASFFQAFGSAMEVEEFTPITIAGNDDAVLAVVRCRAKSRDTGKEIDMNLHHYLRFRGGKVYYYRGTEDTAQTEAALSG